MDMEHICAFNFAPFAHKGRFEQESAKDSLRLMKERTAANTVIFVPGGMQDTPQSEKIFYGGAVGGIGDDELKEMISYAQGVGFKVFLKPTVNCKNGTWRAHINFFDEDVPSEPKWSNWFEAYTEFQVYYAKIARQMGVDMHIAGCEMVQSERREAQWRQLIGDIRKAYDGPVSYNTDKYQEHNVKWWDAVDVISSSGYYPISAWEEQLDRIEKVVKCFQKPFFFAEIGCMSVAGSTDVPNDWSVRGAVDLQGQAGWFETMFEACRRRDWINGWGIWSWSDRLPAAEEAILKGNYEVYCKSAESVVQKYYRMY